MPKIRLDHRPSKVWTDGSCINNGSAGASAAIGVCYGDGDKRNFASRILGTKQTNNRAELMAILFVLVTNCGTRSLHIYSDSLYSIRCLTTYYHRWEQNGWVTARGDRVESAELIRYALNMIKQRNEYGSTTTLEHVRGHNGDINNSIADHFAHTAAATIVESGKIRLLRSMGVPF